MHFVLRYKCRSNVITSLFFARPFEVHCRYQFDVSKRLEVCIRARARLAHEASGPHTDGAPSPPPRREGEHSNIHGTHAMTRRRLTELTSHRRRPTPTRTGAALRELNHGDALSPRQRLTQRTKFGSNPPSLRTQSPAWPPRGPSHGAKIIPDKEAKSSTGIKDRHLQPPG